MDLYLTTRVEDDRAVVHVEGEIDIHTGPELREALAGLVTAGHYHLVLDLEEVGFMDSTGLGILIGVLAKLRPHHGSLRLVCTQERILQVFRVTGLNKVFPIHHSTAAAITGDAPGIQVPGVREPEAGTADVLQ